MQPRAAPPLHYEFGVGVFTVEGTWAMSHTATRSISSRGRRHSSAGSAVRRLNDACSLTSALQQPSSGGSAASRLSVMNSSTREPRRPKLAGSALNLLPYSGGLGVRGCAVQWRRPRPGSPGGYGGRQRALTLVPSGNGQVTNFH